MKKSLLIAALTFCCTSAFSQIKIYPKVGMVVSSQDQVYLVAETKLTTETRNKVGMQVGVGLEKSLSQKIALSAELLYTQLGYNQRSEHRYVMFEGAYKLNYIISPVSVNYYVINLPNHQFFLSAGAYGGIFMNGKLVYTTKHHYIQHVVEPQESKFGANEAYGYDILDWGIQFGAGMNFNIGKSEFVLSSSYALGMSKVTEITDKGYTKYGQDGKNKFFTVNLGYVLPSWEKRKI